MARLLLSLFLLAALFVPPASAGTYIRGGTGGVVVTTAANLPLTGNLSLTYRVTTATNAADCDRVDSGSARADCRWNGSAYEPIGVSTSGLTNPLVSNLAGAGFDVTGVDEIISNSVNKKFYPGSSATLINAAIQACGRGSTTDDQGCEITLPRGTIPIDATLVIGGAPIASAMQNGIKLIGHGGGIKSSLNDKLAGTTLVWTGANGGKVLEVHGMNHRIGDFMIDGNLEAGFGIVQKGDNGTGDATGKNIYDNITVWDVLDQTRATDGWAFAFGTANVGQNDHTILNQFRSVHNRHCLLAMDTQGVMNTANTFECTISTASPSVKLTNGSIKFNDFYLGVNLADHVGVQVDNCFTSVEFNTGAIEWTGDAGTVFKFSNPANAECNSFGAAYVSAIRNMRFLRQQPSTGTQYGIDHNSVGDLIVEGNMFTSDNHGRTFEFKFNNPAVDPGTVQNSHVFWNSNRVGWEYGYYRDDPVISLTATGGENTILTTVEGGRFSVRDKDGTAGIGKDATGLFADNNGNNVFDSGDFRFDPNNTGDVSAVGGCPSGACFATSQGNASANALFSQGGFTVFLDENFDSVSPAAFTVINGDGETVLSLNEDATAVLGVAGTKVGTLGLRNATSGTLTLAPPVGALGTPTLTLPAATDQLVARNTTDTLAAKTLTAPKITGVVDWNDVPVDDDDCAGQQGQGWYDTTDGRFEWCNANSGVPDVLGASGPGGATALDDLTDVAITGTPATGATLKYNGTNYVNGPLDLADPDAVSGVLPDANVANDITLTNYMPLSGGTFTGSIFLSSGQGITAPPGSTIQSSGGTIQATVMAGSNTIDDNDVQAGAIDGGTAGEIEDSTITAADLATGSLTAGDAAADLATQAELDALTLPNSAQNGNRIVKSTGTVGDLVESGVALDASNNMTGVGSITATGTLSAPVVAAAQPTGTNVPTLVFTEGVTDGVNTVTIQGPSGGFAADRTCTLQDDATPLDNCVSTGGGGAPTDAPYLTSAAVAGLSAEVVAGTGVATAFQVNVGTAGAFVVNGGALGTPSSGNGAALTNLNAANVSGSLDLGTGTIRGAVSVEATTSTGHTLTAARGQWLFADEAGTTTVTLPALSAGASVCVYAQTDQQVHVDPNGSQVVVLNGTALAGGNKISSPAAGGNAGNFACLLSNGTNWYVLGKAGTWTDGG